MSKLSKLEEKAVKLLLKYEGKGILQSELWHKLKVTSREGSRVAIKLEKKGIVKRVKEFHEDRWTRRLIPLIKKLEFSSIKGAPCPSCEFNNICRPGNTWEAYGMVWSPNSCVWIQDWLLSQLEKQQVAEET